MYLFFIFKFCISLFTKLPSIKLKQSLVSTLNADDHYNTRKTLQRILMRLTKNNHLKHCGESSVNFFYPQSILEYSFEARLTKKVPKISNINCKDILLNLKLSSVGNQ